ncbi:MAG: sigma 54-interacting transcriptional regulator [candidate division Zixibacteria bacterium]|nr:sigma 54-interacting transcriptional regulator [candidate division Zixibacteria bacterium]
MEDDFKNATDTILDSIADGVFTVDKDWRIRSFNKAAETITGISREEAIGQRCCDVFRASICETSCALRHTLESGERIINKIIYIISSEGDRIPITISTAIMKDKVGKVIGGVETFRDLTTIEHLRSELKKRNTFHDIISKNPRMQEIFDILPSIAESDATVVIEGESGTGKELVARAIHDLSSRKNGPIITLNCGALPDSLLEAELFGYVKGAFTDARIDKPGRFALADGGTIFLDEIGDVSPALQVRLLRVLQEKTYEPLGSTESKTANVRVITATNKNLDEMVEKGEFREDLYYRINVIKLLLPPLRERREDIPLLVDHFISRLNSIHNKSITDLSPSTLTILMNHRFPGNVRELQNIIEHAFIISHGPFINPQDLPKKIAPEKVNPVPEASSLNELEADYIHATLRKHNWNRTKAAEELGMHKTTLWRKMKKLGISTPNP